MIYLFLWESYFRNKTLRIWKKAFKEKYGDINLTHILDVSSNDVNFYTQNLLWGSFFSDKKLFIIDDFFLNSDDFLKENFFSLIDKIPSDYILVFNEQEVDKRSKLYKKIVQIWEVKDFSINDRESLQKYLLKEFNWKIDINVINKFIELKWINFLLISKEIEKILILKDRVELSDLENISKDTEENIFEIVDLIMNDCIYKRIQKIKITYDFLDNPYMVYSMLCSQLRIHFYILLLKSKNIKSNDIKISLNLWNRWFLVDKKYKISFEKFKNIYNRLIDIDLKIKSGKLISNDLNDMIYEIEKCFLV